MLWKGRDQSENVDDRRGMRPGLAVGGGIGGVILIVVFLLLGGDPRQILRQSTELRVPEASQTPDATQGQPAPGQDPEREFVGVVLKDTEDVWDELMPQLGRSYTHPHLVLFSDAIESACGLAQTTVGPFYCPEDQRVYLDTAFFADLDRLGGTGDFAKAYVIAHEVGHHVQDLLGVTERVHSQRGQVSDAEYNALSVRLELQADFYAGVWAHYAQASKHILEQGDLEEALQAASAIGDDRLEKRAQGYAVPESFTHGTAEQRAHWFRLGYETGDVRRGDTFNTTQL